MQNKGILIVRNNLCSVVEFAQKCIDAGIEETKVFATVDADDISRFLNTKSISTIIIDSKLYNLSTASILKQYSEFKNIQIVLLTNDNFKKTIRMMMDKNLEYITPEVSAEELCCILGTCTEPCLKKVVHF